MPFHLFFPLCSSLLFVLGLLFVKLATDRGYSPWFATLVANLSAAALFSGLWFLGGEIPDLSHCWQPAAIATLYLFGQGFTFAAVNSGDVSVAAPVFGTKVILVTLMLGVFTDYPIPGITWLAAGLATFGIALVQLQGNGRQESNPEATPVSPGRKSSSTVWTAALAIGAATSFAAFDVLVQYCSPFWGAGRLLPFVFLIVAILSVVCLPWRNGFRGTPSGRMPLFLGSFFVALQALSLVYSLATFEDAARINVVYATRGLWGVLLAWCLSRILGTAEADLPTRTLVWRTIGASLLVISVVLVILLEK